MLACAPYPSRNRWLLVGLLILAHGGCATEAAGPKTGPGASAFAVPARYRQVIAREIAESHAKANRPMTDILKADITPPSVGWMGAFSGGNRPIVCVQLTVKSQGLFTDQSTVVIGYTFENGRVADVFYPEAINPALGGAVGAAIKNAATCGNLSYRPFPELRSKGR